MKRVYLSISIIICIIFLSGCANSTNKTEIQSATYKVIDGYSQGDVDKYNSDDWYSDSNINDTIYIQGVVKEVYTNDSKSSFSLITDDGNRWTAFFDKTVDIEYVAQKIKNHRIYCFGRYGGYNKIFLMPFLNIDKLEIDSFTYTTDDFAFNDITEPSSEPSSEPATESPTENPTKPSENMVELFSDSNVEIYYSYAKYSGYGNHEDTDYYFWIENKLNQKITMYSDTIVIDGISYNDCFSSNDVAANSKGLIKIEVHDCTNTNPSKVGADLRYIIGSDYKYNYVQINSHDVV